MNLVERLKVKEESALIELMHLYGDYLLRTALLLLKDQQTAEEAVQDTFITAFDKITQLVDSDKIKNWLTSILVNRCRTQMRKRSWKNIILTLDLTERFHKDINFSGPEEHLLKLIENQHLADAIQELHYKYREVIIMYYFNEMKISDISSYLKVNENTIKSRLTRGRFLLKDILMRGVDENGSGERKI